MIFRTQSTTQKKDITRKERATLAQLRSGYCRLLGSYKSRIKTYASLNVCADYGNTPHDVKHLFACPAHPTTLIPSDLWSRPTTTTGSSSFSPDPISLFHLPSTPRQQTHLIKFLLHCFLDGTDLLHG